ncbi:site-specific integrase [Pseudonocardia sp. KRD-184]|uniref:Site-specific integrase n=1 Tax=Pseudonocardia oceani TaxID=2792013 RepID=A0ABS6U9Z5_9PSEU|nr:site-specific integrase [Pseudonocardia oceani]MBW0098569.1 site-specific integrase [Pseudonocardia oceani]MBW0111064.1 site-specific integrase [Pseudonocardia oceani]MBW0125034.1 site-specific integrase [Pseudonocardia oceani]MBW0129055.1 site-specific integrase [Pseudonocardia oceani]
MTTKVRSLEKDRDAGQVRKAGRVPTVGQWMTTYLDTIATQRLAPKTLDDYRSKARNWIVPHLGRHRLDRLQPEHLDALYAAMLRAGKAPTHVLKVHRIVSRSLKIAVRRGTIARNVATLVDPPSIEQTEQRQLTRAEARAVLAEAAGRRNAARWSVALACGLRQGEALGLRWEYVDLESGDLKVWWQLQRNSWKHGCADPQACGQRLHRPTCPKGCARHATACPLRYGGGLVFRRPKGKSRRQITMPADLVDAMRLQRTAQSVEREQAGSAWQDLDLVFAQPDGSPIDPRRDWTDWQELTSAAGVRNVRVHDVRHTAGTLLVAQGVHIRAVQEILGHSDVRTTEGYTHVASEIARDAAARMGRALWGADDG